MSRIGNKIRKADTEDPNKRERHGELILSDITNVQNSNNVDLLVIVNNYCNKPTTSQFDPARSYILDLTPESKIRKEFSSDDWSIVIEDNKITMTDYSSEISTITDKLFGLDGAKGLKNISVVRKMLEDVKNVPEPIHSSSYEIKNWDKIIRWIRHIIEPFLDAFESRKSPLSADCHEREWFGDYISPLITGAVGEISVLASQNCQNSKKDVLTMTVSCGHMVDMLCSYEDHEILCLLNSGGPYESDLTKHASDEFHLKRMMKDMLDALIIKFHEATMDDSDLYVLGVQLYLNRVSIYTMNKRKLYNFRLCRRFSMPLTFTSYHGLKTAIKCAWNLRGLINNLTDKLDDLINLDIGSPPTRNSQNIMKTPSSPPRKKKIKTFKD
ncbi:15764_t:CDS:2 [Entrophospora sp. SA101]|nr:15764_t:CDS:2 [Entrophospora sp. SA101]